MKSSLKPRAFLKWAGGKASLASLICEHLPEGRTLVEPFVGAGSIFLRSQYERYVLNDINPDLINLFLCVQRDVDSYIESVRPYFDGSCNNPDSYYAIRNEFNQTRDVYTRSVLFLYLNRFGYNGLCRYNSSGGYNVPFGRYVKPYFPEKELMYFAEKSQKATFTCLGFEAIFDHVRALHDPSQIVYCDPPYAPISKTASFTTYAKGGFQLEQQQTLADVSKSLAKEHGISVYISNHDTDFTRDIYTDAEVLNFKVARNISQNKANRKKAGELLAIYTPENQTNSEDTA